MFPYLFKLSLNKTDFLFYILENFSFHSILKNTIIAIVFEIFIQIIIFIKNIYNFFLFNDIIQYEFKEELNWVKLYY